MTEKVTFRIGDDAIEVPPLNWALIEDHVMPLLEKGADEKRWYVARGNDIRILAAVIGKIRPDMTLDVIKERLNFPQAREVSERLGDLLRISGFNVGEPQAAGTRETEVPASDSTETSTDSSPGSSDGVTPPSIVGTTSSVP